MKTIEIPGGHATMIDKNEELTPRRRRPIELVSARIGKKLEEVIKAARLYCEGDLITDNSAMLDEDGKPIFDGDVDVSEHELDLISRLNDACTWALLVGWTLDLPLPRSVGELVEGGCPLDVFDVLRTESGAIMAALGDGGFTVDAVEETDSPTGAFAG